jgi:putative ABC transport system permease protein
VVRDVRHAGLDDNPRPAVYVPYAQAPSGALVLTIRGTGDAAELLQPVSRAIWAIAPTLPVYSAATLDDLRHASLRVRRFVLLLLGVFATSALGLAALGVYGLLNHATTERTREFGLRLALGARTSAILGGVLGSGAALAAAGLVIGAAGAVAGTRLLQSMLFGVDALDVGTFAGGAAVILASAAIASLVPAWRAARVDPASTLKS